MQNIEFDGDVDGLGEINYREEKSSRLLTTAYTFYKSEYGSVSIYDNHGFMVNKFSILNLITGLQEFLSNEITDEEIAEYNLENWNDELNQQSDITVKPKKKTTYGYVYLLKADNGLVKIGKTIEIDQRMEHFTIKLPYELELVHYIETNDYTLLETKIHNEYSEFRIRGEWFKLTENHIKNIKEKFGEKHIL